MKIAPSAVYLLLASATAAAYQAEANNVAMAMTESATVSETATTTELHKLFDQWTEKFVREYATVEERVRRRAIWLENHVRIVEHNKGDDTYTMAHNQFSDLTFEEFEEQVKIGKFAAPMRRYNKKVKKVPTASAGGVGDIDIDFDMSSADNEIPTASAGGIGDIDIDMSSADSEEPIEEIQHGDEGDMAVQRRANLRASKDLTSDTSTSSTSSSTSSSSEGDSLPEYVNWVEEGAVASVKNQGMCGSCWAFSAVGAIEGAFAIKTGELVEFSEQQLVDCDINGQGDEQDMGCNGGLMDNAFRFEENEEGLCTLGDYPYAGKQNTCADTSCTNVEGSAVTGFVDVEPEKNKALMEAIMKQPVSVAIQADQLSFQFYQSGVFNGRCGTNIDHGVLAVGYGTDEKGGDYWLVKNSWGETWGEEGYIRLARNMEVDDAGKCGIMQVSSYPVYE